MRDAKSVGFDGPGLAVKWLGRILHDVPRQNPESWRNSIFM